MRLRERLVRGTWSQLLPFTISIPSEKSFVSRSNYGTPLIEDVGDKAAGDQTDDANDHHRPPVPPDDDDDDDDDDDSSAPTFTGERKNAKRTKKTEERTASQEEWRSAKFTTFILVFNILDLFPFRVPTKDWETPLEERCVVQEGWHRRNQQSWRSRDDSHSTPKPLGFADAGSAQDLMSRKFIEFQKRGVSKNPLDLVITNGPDRTTEQTDVKMPILSSKTAPYLLEDAPTVISIGRRCVGWKRGFIWRGANQPYSRNQMVQRLNSMWRPMFHIYLRKTGLLWLPLVIHSKIPKTHLGTGRPSTSLLGRKLFLRPRLRHRLSWILEVNLSLPNEMKDSHHRHGRREKIAAKWPWRRKLHH